MCAWTGRRGQEKKSLWCIPCSKAEQENDAETCEVFGAERNHFGKEVSAPSISQEQIMQMIAEQIAPLAEQNKALRERVGKVEMRNKTLMTAIGNLSKQNKPEAAEESADQEGYGEDEILF